MKMTIGKMAVGLALLLAGAAYIAPVLDNDTGGSMQRVAAKAAKGMMPYPVVTIPTPVAAITARTQTMQHAKR